MNLMEGLLKELNRNREYLQRYKEIGSSGVFGAAIIQDKIDKAEKAIAKGDVVEMLVCYNELQKTE